MYEIYLVTNVHNNKKYVGQTCQGFLQRWGQHKSAARSGVDNYFYRALRKYGEDGFTIEVIEETENLEQANEDERKWIKYFNCIDSQDGYNGTHGGDGSTPTDTTCQKISETRKRLFQDPEFKAKMSEANKGKRHTPEGKANISRGSKGNFKLGTKQREESKAKISESLKKAYAEGRHAPSAGLKKGTILGPMSEEEKKKRSDGVKRARQERFWSTKKKVLPTTEMDAQLKLPEEVTA